MDRRIFLKIKLKSLACEARIIRREEARLRDRCMKEQAPNPRPFTFARGEMEAHRRYVVGKEARHTLLAYSFIRGRAFHEVEQKSKTPPDWEKVWRMVDRYGGQGVRPEYLSKWYTEAQSVA